MPRPARVPLPDRFRLRTGLRTILAVVSAPAWLLALVLMCGTTPQAAATGLGAEPEPVGVWPLTPRPDVVRGFDPPEVPWSAGHRGVDLAGGLGQSVRAALPGRVTFAGSVAGRGVVSIGHGATRTTYQPVRATVSVGDRVPAGGRIGVLLAAGSHCFPAACLHWGRIRNADEVYLDPLELVGDAPAPVRLLPLWRAA